jgi:type IV pilus assembly protein PilV
MIMQSVRGPSRRPPGHTPRRTGGFTLVEALVALVVMAVGLLGIAGLYVEGLRAGRTSVYRSAAVTLASDMADRIRANPQGAYAGSGPGADNACVNGPADCSADQLAADDWFRWREELARRLPSGAEAEVTIDAVGSAREVLITVAWPEGGQEAPASYSLALRL